MDKESTRHLGKYSISHSVALNNNNEVPKKGLNRHQKLILASLAFGNFGAAIPSALQAPFFPQEAERKGASPSEYGFVFAIYQLAIFFTSPIFGKCLALVGPKLMLNIGIAVLGICSILFGFLNHAPPGWAFLFLANLIRALAGVGSSAYRTASFSIISSEFHDNVASRFATIETMYGVGQIVGPAIGGALYQVGGFSLPFVGSGFAILLCGIVTWLLLPNPELSDRSTETGNLLKFLWCPNTLLAAMMMGVNSLCLGFNHVSLEPHLRQFNLSPLWLGTVFVVPGMSYAMAAPVWGYFCSKKYNPKYLGIISLVILFICFFFIGPLPGIPIQTSVWLVVLCLLLFGFGGGGLRVISFVDCLNDTLENRHYPNDMTTYGLVSGVMTAAISIGYFCGPTTGGFLLDQVGYKFSTVILLAVQVFLFAWLLIMIWKDGQKKKQVLSETTPLIV